MLRILLWRASFEFWHLVAFLISRLPILQRFNREVTYFAFGANLSSAVLQNRQIRPLAQQDYLLEDHELRFNQPGPYKGFGFASVHAAPGKKVFGRLIRMTRVDEMRMDYFELVPVLRRHRKITLTRDGKTFFFYQATRPLEGLRPTEEYLGKIMQAVEQSEIIPPDLLAELKAVRPLDKLEPPEGRNFLVEIARWPPLLRPLGLKYDVWCRLFMMSIYQRRLFQRWIRV